MFYRYLFYIVVDWSFTLLCYSFINWWAPLFADEAGYLPNWLKWVHTFDDTLDAGTRDGIFPASNSRYGNRVRWLHRNPAYGFGYYVLGIPFVAADWTVEKYDAATGEFTARCKNGHYNKRFVWRGIRIKFGMKAWNMFDRETGAWKTEAWGPEMRIPFSFSPSKA